MYCNKEWHQRRIDQLLTAPLCALCGRAAQVADHTIPHRGDAIKFNGELQSLCLSCHGAKSSKESS